jgi:hypothetical protein
LSAIQSLIWDQKKAKYCDEEGKGLPIGIGEGKTQVLKRVKETI